MDREGLLLFESPTNYTHFESEAQEVFDEKSAKSLQKKIISNTFTFVDFQNQLKQMKNMGSISEMLALIPNASKIGKSTLDDSQVQWMDAIISSMTFEERNMPSIITGSRRKRIALGSGRSIQEVNQLLKQFQAMQAMMKKISKKGKMKIPFNFK